jgi:hypothetical protein
VCYFAKSLLFAMFDCPGVPRYLDVLGHQARNHAAMVREQLWDGDAAGQGGRHRRTDVIIPAPSPPAHQDFYGLIDHHFEANPDAFAAALHQLLMGAVVLNASSAGAPLAVGGGSSIRAYAHCAPSGAAAASVLLIHVGSEDVNVAVKIDGAGSVGASTATAYVVTSAAATEQTVSLAEILASHAVQLNGKLLDRRASAAAALKHTIMRAGVTVDPTSLKMPPYSYAFVALGGSVAACKTTALTASLKSDDTILNNTDWTDSRVSDE